MNDLVCLLTKIKQVINLSENRTQTLSHVLSWSKLKSPMNSADRSAYVDRIGGRSKSQVI